MKKILALVLVLVLVFAFTACGKKEEESAPAAGSAAGSAAAGDAQETYEVAVVCRPSDMYGAWLAEAYTAEAENHPRLNVTIVDYQDDQMVMLQCYEDCVAQGYDFIVSQMPQADSMTYIDMMHDAGIPYIGINGYRAWLDGAAPQIGCDEVLLGYVIGEAAAKALPEGANYVILEGPAGNDVSMDRTKGMRQAIADAGRDDLVELDLQNADFQKDTAMVKTDDWLQIFPDIDCVLAGSDSMVLGAIESFRTNGRDISETLFYGIDGLTDACLSIAAGEETGSALQDAEQFAKIALEMIDASLDSGVSLIDEFEPYTKFTPILLDKDNVQAQLDYYKSVGFID